MDRPLGVGAVELGEAVADLGAAADARRHQRQPVERALRIALGERRGHMRETGVEEIGLGLTEGLRDRVEEAGEEGDIELHRARGVEQRDEAQRLRLAAPEFQVDRLAAARDRTAAALRADRAASPRRRARSRRERRVRMTRGEPFGERQRLGALRLARQAGEVFRRQRLVRRGAAFAAAARRRRSRSGASRRALRQRGAPDRRRPPAAPGRSERAGRRPTPRTRTALLDAAPAPEGVEQLVEAAVFAAVRGEQRLQRAAQPVGPVGKRARNQPRGVADLGAADGEPRLAQRVRRNPRAGGACARPSSSRLAARARVTPPSPRAAPSLPASRARGPHGS